jgi:hypothetical protein
MNLPHEQEQPDGPEHLSFPTNSIVYPVVPALLAYDDYMYGKNLGPHSLAAIAESTRNESDPTEVNFEWTPDLKQLHTKAVETIGGMILAMPPMEDEAGYVKRWLSQRQAGLDDESPEMKMIAHRALAAAEKNEDLRRMSAETIGALELMTLEQQMEMVQLLATSIPTKPRPGTNDVAIRDLQDLYAFDLLGRQEKKPAFDAAEKIKSGELDPLIAAEALRYLASAGGDIDPPGAAGLRSLLKYSIFISQVSGVDTLIQRMTTSEALDHWHPAAKDALQARKQVYLAAIEKNFTVSAKFLDNYYLPLRYSTELEAGHIVSRLVSGVLEKKARNTLLSNQERVKALALLKRGSVLILIEGGADANAEANGRLSYEANDSQEPRGIFYYKPNGDKGRQGSLEYNDFLDSFVRTHGGGHQLREDIDRMVTGLQTTDYKNGLPKEFRELPDAGHFFPQIGAGDLAHIARSRDLGGKPRSKVGNSTRFVLSIKDGGEIGILAIITAKELDELQRRKPKSQKSV